MTSPVLDRVLAPQVLAQTGVLAERFQAARPFRHLLLDGFFEAEFAERLLGEFPAFDESRAMNEAGEIGLKASVETVRELGPAFGHLDDTIRSRAFLEWLSAATAIPDLLYDPDYFGGGTHENLHGQDLDPHVDFNFHPRTRWHRRLNLIVYLNRRWDPAWGGGLELHSDPRRPEEDQVVTYTPVMNRCVIFETTESSWHGFLRIDLPPGLRHLSRRSIALYFYTRDRPPEETGRTHSTIYVDRPLPDRFTAGATLDEADVRELQVLLRRRDMHLQRLYGELEDKQARIEALESMVVGSPAWRTVRALRHVLGRGRRALRRQLRRHS